MRYFVDKALCSGHGRCEAVAPTVYRLDDEGYNEQVGQFVDVPPGSREAAHEGAWSCPDAAIRVFES